MNASGSWSRHLHDEPPGAPSLAAQFQESGIPLVQWQKKPGFSLLTVRRLVQLIFAEDTRIVHVHDLGPLVYGSLAKVLSLGRVRLFVTPCTPYAHCGDGKGKTVAYYINFFLRFADRIIAVSPEVRSGLLDLGVPEKRIEVIPNGVTFAPARIRVDKSRRKRSRCGSAWWKRRRRHGAR